ncbi:MAG: hypothetical protein FWG25_08795, partial [Promicromonosporaceae bacterium]|nr:hypothetical protein [Promicromonosporaceae bacterium]
DSTVVNADGAQAWIMFASSDWSIMYSAGDDYDPESKTDGLVVTDAEITGPGTYTVGIDFTGTASGYADGIAFSAIGISNGEDLYPGYKIDITGIEVNGQSYEMNGKPYTASDNGSTTRTNLLNDWVDGIPGDARFVTDDGTGATASILSNDDLGHIESLFITFEYLP